MAKLRGRARVSSPWRIGSARKGYAALTLVLLAVVTAPLLIPGAPETVFARRYGYHQKNYGATYAKYIARCKAGCGRANGAIAACINRDRNVQVSNCRQVFNADRADCTDKSCVKDLKSRLKLCMRGVAGDTRSDRKAMRYGVTRCDGCCQRTKGQGGCLSYFSSSRFNGSYRYHGRVNCSSSYGGGGGGGGGDCVRQCQLAAARARAACGPAKKADAACLQQVAQALQACVAQCQSPGTTTTTSTTTTTNPGSPSGAFVRDRSARIRDHVAGWLPWLVRGWND